MLTIEQRVIDDANQIMMWKGYSPVVTPEVFNKLLGISNKACRRERITDSEIRYVLKIKSELEGITDEVQ